MMVTKKPGDKISRIHHKNEEQDGRQWRQEVDVTCRFCVKMFTNFLFFAIFRLFRFFVEGGFFRLWFFGFDNFYI